MNKAQNNYIHAFEAAQALPLNLDARELELARTARASLQGIKAADYAAWLEDFNNFRTELVSRGGLKTASELNAEKASAK
jgi:hypothetical protein